MVRQFEKQAEEILAGMSLHEKVGQLNQITVVRYGKDFEPLKEAIRRGEIGSLLMADTATAGNDSQGFLNTDLYNELQRVAVEESPRHIPMLFGRDVIHGHRTVFPVPLASSAAFNDELVETCYRDIAQEAASDGIHWTFSPMVDLSRDPRWGRIIEGPGEDPCVGERLARACVKGFQGDDLSDPERLIACAKHYIGYGASEGGRDYHRTEISDVTLYNYYVPAFRAAVEAGAATVMSSFNDISGTPVTGSKKYLTEILRDQLGFDGFVVSDWCAVRQLQKQGVAESPADCAKIALEAGLDMDMVDNCYTENLETLVREGKVAEETVDIAVKRVLCVKLAAGLFDHPYRRPFAYDREAHRAHARQLAAESMVLLKNDGVLPLDRSARVMLCGPFARERRSLLGSWTLDGRAEDTPNLAEAIREKLTSWMNVQDWGLFDNINLHLPNTDVLVLALGESCFATGENRCVSDVSLDAAQRDLIRKARATGKKTVGVIFCGRPVAMDGVADELDAVLYAWHTGSEAAHAAADILFGDTVPSGKTPVTFLRQSGHIPLYYNVTSSGREVDCYYGEHPERCYLDSLPTPRFPFGFGLSYTEFSVGAVRVEEDILSLDALKNGACFRVSVEVSNVGGRDGKETVQLYLRDPVAGIMRPIRELKDYRKVSIPAGGTVTVAFELGYDRLGYYDGQGRYTVEPGAFEVYVGSDCLTANAARITVL